MGERVVTVNDVLDGHTVLDISCLDRLYLSGFVQKLQTPGGVVYFLHQHRGMPIASPAVFEQIGSRFRDGMRRFAEANHIPVVRFRRDDRKVEVMRPYLDRAAGTGRSQVAAIGVAQEFAPVWTARKRDTDPAKPPQFSFTKQQRRVTVFYVYVWDDDFGPAFIKLCAYFPTRSRSGSTATSGPSGRLPRPGSASPHCPTGSPLATSPRHCRPSATGSARARSGCSSNDGSRGCRCRFQPPIVTPGTGGT
jgi:hypothetical protein